MSTELERAQNEITYLRARIRFHRALIGNLKTIVFGMNNAGKPGKKSRRYIAIERCRELIREWESNDETES